MAEALLPFFRNPEQVNRLFMDHLMLGVGHHVADRYGGMRPVTRPVLSGLTPYQVRRAKELLTENISGDLPLATLAGQCGLSLTHFSKAFRKSIGVPPHKWLIQQRIELSKTLLRDTPMSLAEIALACGFSNQSHFTRFFSANVGVSPGIWRRTIKT
jgi:transcriptional regulator GlxA family with amidase domain